ncbi:hypothetical protein DFH28DRAFT_930679 [Melampsora americana]|nr:hypothetical protein DFH28DRAFT_930679 [Melampsora americana]
MSTIINNTNLYNLHEEELQPGRGLKPSTNNTVNDSNDVSETSDENHGDDSEYNLQENSDLQANSSSLEDHQVHSNQNPNSLVDDYSSNDLDKAKSDDDVDFSQPKPLDMIAATNASEQAVLMAKTAADQHEYNMKKLALKQDNFKHAAAELAWQHEKHMADIEERRAKGHQNCQQALNIERQKMVQHLMASYRESKGVVNNSNIDKIEQTVIAAFGKPICFVQLGLPQSLPLKH